jgi:serine phosphatase RsbU (regulator of sigma subunit)
MPELPGYAIHAVNVPSRTVSGDLYTAGTRETGECVLMVADVSGKGMAAALLTASLEALSVGPIEVGLPPDEICAKVSRRLYARTHAERYATAFLALLEPGLGRVRFTNAGHNPAVVMRAGGDAERLEATGVPLGLLPNMDYAAGALELRPGDTLAIYTDGITEAANPAGEEYGIGRLEEVLRAGRAQPLPALAAAIEDDSQRFAKGEPYADDRTLVLLRRLAGG